MYPDSVNTFGKVSGTSLDWAYGEAGIYFATTLELGPFAKFDGGNMDMGHGFYNYEQDAIQIEFTAEESWAFHQSVSRQLIEKFNLDGKRL